MSSKGTDLELGDIGEQAWIRRVRRRLPPSGPGVLVGPGDDAAITRIKSPIISTTDLLIEDVHFIRRLHPPRLLGRKALSVNLSDVAAMAGIPRFALLSLGLSPAMKQKDADEFVKGFLEVAKKFNVRLIGGDTTEAEKMTVSVTVLAEVNRSGAALRSGARDGDAIYVTGNPGDASLGLHILGQKKKSISHQSAPPYAALFRRHLDPRPRVELGMDLAGIANAMIDLSDGLATDLGHILEESRPLKRTLAAEINVSLLPVSGSFRKYFSLKPSSPLSGESLRFAVQGGEDYELLFTARGAQRPLSRLAKKHRVPITRIGVIHKAERTSIQLIDHQGGKIALPEPVFEHFSLKASRPGSRKGRRI